MFIFSLHINIAIKNSQQFPKLVQLSLKDLHLNVEILQQFGSFPKVSL